MPILYKSRDLDENKYRNLSQHIVLLPKIVMVTTTMTITTTIPTKRIATTTCVFFVKPSPKRYWSSRRFLDYLTMSSINHHYGSLLIPDCVILVLSFPRSCLYSFLFYAYNLNVLKGMKGKWEFTTHEKGGMYNLQKGVIITHKCDLMNTRKYFCGKLSLKNEE